MQNSSDDKYVADIPGQPNGTTIDYFVEATDNAGNSGRSQTVSFKIGEDDTGCFSFILTMPSSGPPAMHGFLFILNIFLLWILIWRIGKRGFLSKCYRSVAG